MVFLDRVHFCDGCSGSSKRSMKVHVFNEILKERFPERENRFQKVLPCTGFYS